MNRSLGLVLIAMLLSGTATYVATKTRYEHNRPLTFEEQLAQEELTDENEMLLKDILQPSFGSVALTGVAQTNHCGASEKGCFRYGTQMFTEEEFNIYTGRDERVSLLSYTTDQPITQASLTTLKEKVGTRPYRLIDPATPIAGSVDEGVASLFSFSVIANIGETRILLVLQPQS